MTVTQKLSDVLGRSISASDRRRAALLWLDWTGCAVAGAREPAGQKVSAAFADETGRCMRIGAGSSSLLMAALHNGCLGNVLEMDDVDKRAVLHAAPTVFPAALAMAQQTHASVEDFLDAVIIGYEATIRIGRAVGAGHYAFWHNTATCGPFGAAAAACHLLGGRDLVSALGLAGTQAAGLWQTRHEADSMAKQLHAGHAAHAGVLAAVLSAQGFQGPRSILDGEQGFFAAMCPGANAQDVLVDYGDNWLIHQTSIKPYPACRHAHAAIDAALSLRGKTDWQNADEIIIETYADALKFCDKPEPKTIIEAKFSLQHNAAVALAKGSIRQADFDPLLCPAAFDDDNSSLIAQTRAKIKLRLGAEIQSRYPQQYGAAITAGDCHVETYDALGDPEKPMSEAQIIGKAESLMQYGGLPHDKAKAVIQAVLNMDLNAYLEHLP